MNKDNLETVFELCSELHYVLELMDEDDPSPDVSKMLNTLEELMDQTVDYDQKTSSRQQ
jgi:hypothetical protein